MPSICIAARPSVDSGSISLDDPQPDPPARTRRPVSFTEETLHSSSNQTMHHLSVHPKIVDDMLTNTESSPSAPTRFASTDLLGVRASDELMEHHSGSADDILLKSNDASSRIGYSRSEEVPVVIRKMEKYPAKKSFAGRWSKPFNTLRLTMPKAFQSQSTISVIEPPVSMQKSIREKKPQTDADQWKDTLARKEMTIVQLTRTCQEERARFEKEIQQLRQYVEHLQQENLQLKKQLNMQ